MKQGYGLPHWMRRSSWAGLLLLLGSVSGWSQQSSPATASSQTDSTAAAIHELQQQVKELRSAVAEMRIGKLSNTAPRTRHYDMSCRRPATRQRQWFRPRGIRTNWRRRLLILLLPQAAQPGPNQTATVEERVASLEESIAIDE